MKDKSILITGGTGSFGNALVNKLIKTDIREIRILSRDEKKQEDMRNLYNDTKLKFYIGDVRNSDSLNNSMQNIDYIFHAAALKQVPSCEFFPMEAFNTNVQGSKNVIEQGIYNGVKKIICLSTDKAVKPINVMGMTKAMMEKLAIAQSRFTDETKTQICVTRYGNVLASRGSVIPLFLNQIKNGEPITVTDLEMTRFVMTLDSAIDLVLFALEKGNNGDILIQKSPAASIKVIYEAVLEYLKLESYPLTILGHRHGEKKHETLISHEESLSTVDLGKFYRIQQDERDLNYSNYSDSGVNSDEVFEYNSINTTQLNKFELAKILESLKIG